MLAVKRSNFLDNKIFPSDSKPYLINISRITTIDVTTIDVELFGYDDNSALPNFGNPASISVTSLIPSVSYARILAQSQSKPFKIGAYIFKANANIYNGSSYTPPFDDSSLPALQAIVAQQMLQTFLVKYFDANGRQCLDPIPQIYTDPYQYQANYEVFEFPTYITGSSALIVPMLPPPIVLDPFGNPTPSVLNVILMLFPISIVDGSNAFSGKSQHQNYGLPDVPALNKFGNKIDLIRT